MQITIKLTVYFKDEYESIINKKTLVEYIPNNVACLLVKGAYYINDIETDEWVIQKTRVKVINQGGFEYEIIVQKQVLKFK